MEVADLAEVSGKFLREVEHGKQSIQLGTLRRVLASPAGRQSRWQRVGPFAAPVVLVGTWPDDACRSCVVGTFDALRKGSATQRMSKNHHRV